MRYEYKYKVMIGLLTVLLIVLTNRCMDAYTEDLSVTRYRVPGVSNFSLTLHVLYTKYKQPYNRVKQKVRAKL